jgi:Asp-tRNA(Asn)/Glu-tRNA(Gln) amidotransferase A subunit family amidase
MNKEDICYMPAYEMADKIKRQELTSLEIAEIMIERIEKINPIINAYCTPTFDLAREMAKKADEAVKNGQKVGLLQGIPISIKDDTETKGIRTTNGSKYYENYVPKEDNIVVKRLKDAGCVILGKTNLPEFGFKGVTDNLLFGATKNPWNLERTPGGSSGGAAAGVASGLSTLALGADGGGSIRIPSSLCGVYGIKPHFGRVPYVFLKTGAAIDTMVQKGPIARYVKDAALMLDVLAGPDESDRFTLPEQNISYFNKLKEIPKNLKIGYSKDLGLVKTVDSEVEKCFLNVVQKFEKLDWSVEKSKIRLKNIDSMFYVLWSTGFANMINPLLKQWRDKMDPLLIEIVEEGLKYSVLDIQMAGVQRENIYESVRRQFKKFDLLITPTLACTAFELYKIAPDTINGIPVSLMDWLLTYPFNLTGHPAASIPCGWSSEGLPIGMQIIGKRFDEVSVLQVSKAFEELQPWQERKPNFN